MKGNMDTNMESLIPDLDLNVNQTPDDELYIRDYSFDEDFAAKVSKYNKNITNHNDFYTRFVPSDYRLIVRGYTKEMVITEDGVVLPNRDSIAVKSKGHDKVDFDHIVDPYGFTTKCVVVNAGKDTNYKTEDIVYVAPYTTSMVPSQGIAAEVILRPAGQFLDPDANLTNMPEDPESEHFGYFLITSQDVVGCLKD